MRQGIHALLDAFPALDLPRSFSVVRSRWGADPLCRGSYSYVTPGTTGDDIDALAAPLVRLSSMHCPRAFATDALASLRAAALRYRGMRCCRCQLLRDVESSRWGSAVCRRGAYQ